MARLPVHAHGKRAVAGVEAEAASDENLRISVECIVPVQNLADVHGWLGWGSDAPGCCIRSLPHSRGLAL